MKFQIQLKQPKRQSINRTIRFSPEVFEQLEELAEKYKISFNCLANQCIQYALEHIDEEEPASF